MAENLALARPYAEAAFKLAKETGTLPAWSEMLDRLALIASDPDMTACIANPRLTGAQLTGLVAGVAGNLTAEQQNLVRVLVDNERLGVLPEIRDLFVDLKDADAGTQEALIASAFPIPAKAQQQLVASLEQRFQCKIRATVTLDPELIGGVRISVGDQVIDASVRGKLAAMAAALQN